MTALPDGAIRQIRHMGLLEEAGLDSTVVWAAGAQTAQKWAVWAVVDSKTPARQTTARQLNQLVGRDRMFTVLATSELDATIRSLTGFWVRRSA